MTSNGYSYNGQPNNNGILRNGQNRSNTYNKNTYREVFNNAFLGNGQTPAPNYNYVPQRSNLINGPAKNNLIRATAGYDSFPNQSLLQNINFPTVNESVPNIAAGIAGTAGFPSEPSASTTSGSYFGDTESSDNPPGFQTSDAETDNETYGANQYTNGNQVSSGGNNTTENTGVNNGVTSIVSQNFYQTLDEFGQPNNEPTKPDEAIDEVVQTLDEFGNPTNVFGQSLSQLLTKPPPSVQQFDEFTQANANGGITGEHEYENLREIDNDMLVVDVATSCECVACDAMSGNLEFLTAVLIPKHEYALSFILTALVLIFFCLFSWFYAIFMQYWAPKSRCLRWFD